jgi:hypothetical protein
MKIFDYLRDRLAARRADAAALAAFEAAGYQWWETATPEKVAQMNMPNFGIQDDTVELQIITVDHLDERGYPPLTRELAQAMDRQDAGGPPVHIVHTGADIGWADELKAVRNDIDDDPRTSPGLPEITSDNLTDAEIEMAREDAIWAARWKQFDEGFAADIARLESWMADILSSTPAGRRAVYRLFSELRVRDFRLAEAAGEAVTELFASPVVPRALPHPGNNTNGKRLRHRTRRLEQETLRELIAA